CADQHVLDEQAGLRHRQERRDDCRRHAPEHPAETNHNRRFKFSRAECASLSGGETAMTIKQGSMALSLARILSACGTGLHLPGGSVTAPRQVYTLSGVVTARMPGGPQPLAGARVIESRSQHTTTTGPDGSFLMNMIPMSPDTAVSVSKVG